MPTDLPTMADQLRDNGYSTHIVGKWHLGFCKWDYTPLERGFDTFFGYYGGAEDYFTHDVSSQIAGKSMGGYDLRDNKEQIMRDNVYSSNMFTSQAIDIIENVMISRGLFIYRIRLFMDH
eukprot:UN23624